jgi:hypothetical protein
LNTQMRGTKHAAAEVCSLVHADVDGSDDG